MDQIDLFETREARTLLDQLLTDSRLYTRSKDFKDLLKFVIRLRNFAPFNAMLLQVQKPGLNYAASARDWQDRFNRTPKEGARPLLILWPFAPVALVYDVQDTEGAPLPEDVASFFAQGEIDDMRLNSFQKLLRKKHIDWKWVDAGDNRAGSIRSVQRTIGSKTSTGYCMHINRNHDAPVKFSTLAHELGHLLLGHLGQDPKLKIRKRPPMDHAQLELEAEAVAYLVCARNGVSVKSETYLSKFVDNNMTVDHLDLYQIMLAAGRVEEFLGLKVQTKYDKPKPIVKAVPKSIAEKQPYGANFSDETLRSFNALPKEEQKKVLLAVAKTIPRLKKKSHQRLVDR